MLAIAVVLVSHSYALTSLFPYVGYMVQSLGISDDKDEAGQSVLAYSLGYPHNICTKKEGKRERGGTALLQPQQHTRAPCLFTPSYGTHLFVCRKRAPLYEQATTPVISRLPS